MNGNLSKFKTPIDKINPLSFFVKVLNQKHYDKFIESIYPKYGLGFTKLENGGYSFYVNTGYYNEHGDFIENTEEYKGSILNDLTEILKYYISEIGALLEKRKKSHLYESKKLDKKYLELLIEEIDSVTSNLDFISNQKEKRVVLDLLRETRRLVDSYLSDNVTTPVKQKHFDYEAQYSYLLGETNYREIESIYNLLETQGLLDAERNSLEAFKVVFSSPSLSQVEEQVILESDKIIGTAFFYALEKKYPHFKLIKIENSNSFYYVKGKSDFLKITQSAINTQHSRIHKKVEYLHYFDKFLEGLNFKNIQ